MKMQNWVCYPMSCYDIDTSKPVMETTSKMRKLASDYSTHGMRRSYRFVLLCHNEDGFPCLIHKKKGGGMDALFGGKAAHGESVQDAISRKLRSKFYGTYQNSPPEIGELLSVWWRLNFTQTILPQLPLHATRPKEKIEVYSVYLPEKCVFLSKSAVAVKPVHDLGLVVDHASSELGDCPILKSLPATLSRYAIKRLQPAQA